MTVETISIAGNLARLQERVGRAAKRARRRPEEITLVAVSKTFPAEAIREAYDAGVRHFGENQLQEWETKCAKLEGLEATWHLVGHLQSNKAVRAVRLFHSIDSLDSLPLAKRLERLVTEAGPENRGGERKRILIEVRVAPEKTKYGVEEQDLPELVEAVLALPHLELRGMMCIPPPSKEPEEMRAHFRKLRELRDALAARFNIALPELSMGMSQDFETAIEEGSTQVRIGTAIFGSRSTIREPR